MVEGSKNTRLLVVATQRFNWPTRDLSHPGMLLEVEKIASRLHIRLGF